MSYKRKQIDNESEIENAVETYTFEDIHVNDGTVGMPSVSFTDETDMGIYREAAGQWSVSTGGVKRMRLDSTGVRASDIHVENDVSVETGGSANVVSSHNKALRVATAGGSDVLVVNTNTSTVESQGLHAFHEGIQYVGKSVSSSPYTVLLTDTYLIAGAGASILNFPANVQGRAFLIFNLSSGELTLNGFNAGDGTDIFVPNSLTTGFYGGTYVLGRAHMAWVIMMDGARLGVFESVGMDGAMTMKDGSVTKPIIRFNTDENTGLYRIGSDDIGVTTGGVQRMHWTTTHTEAVTPLRSANGSLAVPSYSYANFTTHGWNANTNVLDCVVNGALQIEVDALANTVNFQSNNLLLGGSGVVDSQAGEQLSFNTYASDSVSLVAAAAEALTVTQAYTRLPGQLRPVNNGTNAAPTYSFNDDQDTGAYRVDEDEYGIAVNGTLRLHVHGARVETSVPLQLPSYTVVGVPSVTPAGQWIYVSDDAGSPATIMAYSDGTNWRRCDTAAVLS